MSIGEGYIKYKSFWHKKAIEVEQQFLKEINLVRTKLIAYNMIGKIQGGPGFGNISMRSGSDQFYISATNTGHLTNLNSKDIALVTDVNIDTNSVWCMGESNASSESMSHAVIYQAKSNVNAVIHIHYSSLWNKLKNKVPTTGEKTAYGTPEMAIEISELLKVDSSERLLVLGGHEDGIISYGNTLHEAFEVIEQEYLKM